MNLETFLRHVPLEELAADVAAHGTPVYLVYERIVADRAAALSRALGPRFELLFATKANPLPALLSRMRALGLGFDVASGGELDAALAAGADPARVELTGPGKSDTELARAVAAGVGSVNVESLDELDRLAAIATARGVRARVGLRVNLRSAAFGGIRMGGDAQFGLREDELDAAVDRVLGAPAALALEGLHVHQGSQVLDARAMVARFEATLGVAARVAARAGPLAKLNLGGGFGVDYWEGQAPLDLDALGRGVEALLAGPAGAAASGGCRLLVEPGRFLAAEAGVFAVSVRHVKEGYERTFAIADSGLHHASLLSGGLGQVLRRDFRHVVLPAGAPSSAPPAPGARPVSLAGPLCLPQDVLLTDAPWPPPGPRRGDTVCFLNCGAYGRSASPVGFLGHEACAEVVR